MKTWWGVGLALVLAACGQSDDAAQETLQAWVGKDLSALKVETLDGQSQALKDALQQGKPLVVNVWATWCPPCLKEMPTLDALGKQGSYTVIAIATDKDAQTVKDFLKKQSWGSGVQVWFDSLGEVTRKQMGATGIPVTFVVGKDLKVRLAEAGERDWAHPSMARKMERAIEGQ